MAKLPSKYQQHLSSCFIPVHSITYVLSVVFQLLLVWTKVYEHHGGAIWNLRGCL